MCRQFYRPCRDCHEMFSMPDPYMREPCKEFRILQAIKPHLKNCPWDEIRVLRPPSGHGPKVCEPCRKKNRDAQRKRENAQKRARRAKLKKDKMTAGIGTGNVVWTPPNVRTPSVMDASALALHSPQPRRPYIVKVRSTTQALQYALNKNTSTTTMTQNHIDVSQHEHGVYSQSRQMFAATMSNVLQPNEKCHDLIVNDVCDDTNLHHYYDREPQDLPTKPLDESFYQASKRPPVGLGITMPDDTKWNGNHTDTCSFNEWSFRMELNKWSTVFEDDDPDDTKEL